MASIMRYGLGTAVAVWLGCAGMLTAQTTVNWTGYAGDGKWSNPGNWEDGIVPNSTNYFARFGDSSSNLTHTVYVDGTYTVRRVVVVGTGDRQYTFEADGEDALLRIGGESVGIMLLASSEHDAVFNVDIRSLLEAQFYPHNSSSHRLIFNGDFTLPSGRDLYVQYGKQEFNSSGSVRNFQLDVRNPVDVTLRSADFTIGRAFLSTGTPAVPATLTARFGTDFVIGWQLDLRHAEKTYFQSIESGAADRTVTVGRAFVSGHNLAQLVFLENDAGSSGRFILRTTGSADNGQHTLPIETRDNSVIRFDSTGSSVMTFGANTNRAARIGGAGSLWKSNTGTLTVHTENTYSGRTMISGGTLQLGSHTLDDETFYGQLPAGTIVELGTNAIFNLNGIAQTLGGLTGFRGLDRDDDETFGTVALGGAALTVHAAQASSFRGAITGTGTLVKAGAATFTLAAGYTNVADRTLRVAGGVLAVTGALSVEDGTFQLAGGQLTAGTLASADAVWDVTLHAANEDQILVAIAGNADITDATLDLKLAGGYIPAYGAEYTLLYAGSITGASQGGSLFGITDGHSFIQHGQEYEIRWKNGSGQIILTAIPEPGSLLLLAPAGLLLWIGRRRTSAAAPQARG